MMVFTDEAHFSHTHEYNNEFTNFYCVGTAKTVIDREAGYLPDYMIMLL